jgi:NAD+ synthase
VARPALPALDLRVVTEILERFIRAESAKFGFDKVILGVSGGIDSSVALALAVRALGAGNVVGLLLPYKKSSAESESLGRGLCQSLGVDPVKLDITPMVDGYLAAAKLSLENPDHRVRCGNVMARARMVVLFDQSAARRALVLGTSDKTEALLGYTTWYGDSASAINPLGDLYKTQVYALAKHLDIPAAILGRPPSPDLWPGQTAEDEMGIRYVEVDPLLHDLVDRRLHRDEVVARGHDVKLLDWTVERIRANQYKRRLPVIAKVSARTINLDFRYLRDWGR